MAAIIRINSTAGSNDNLPLGTLVNLDSQDTATTYLWSIQSQPAGAPSDVLSSTTDKSPTFTPTREGSYLIQLVVDQGLPTEDTDQVIAAVLELETGNRIPAVGETTQNDAATGWSQTAVDEILRRVTRLTDGGYIMGVAGESIPNGSPVYASGTTTIATGLPGERPLIEFSRAYADDAATLVGNVGMAIQSVDGSPIVSGSIIRVLANGLFQSVLYVGAAPAIGDWVYITDAGSLDTVAGTYGRTMGSVCNVDVGTTTYDVYVGGEMAVPFGPAGGDLSGLYPNPEIAKLQGQDLDVTSTPPASGEVLGWDGSSWVPVSNGASPIGSAGGVLGYTGSTYPNPNGLSAVSGGGYIGLRPDTTNGVQFVVDSVTSGNGKLLKAIAGDSSGGLGGDATLKGGVGSTAGGAAYLLGGNGSSGGGAAQVVGGTAVASGAGGAITVRGGQANAGAGGNVTVVSGYGSTASGNVTITTEGSALNADGYLEIAISGVTATSASNLTVEGGLASGSGQTGSSVTFNLGYVESSATAGAFSVTSGTGAAAGAAAATSGGDVTLTAGTGGAANASFDGGFGGFVTIQAGTGGAGTLTNDAGDGATVYVYGGAAGSSAKVGSGADGGDVYIRAGSGTGTTGVDGDVFIGTAQTQSVQIGASDKDVKTIGRNVGTPTIYAPLAATTIPVNGPTIFLNPAANRDMTASPTLQTSGITAGTIVTIVNEDSTFYVDMTQDAGGTSYLKLATGNIYLFEYDSITFIFDGTYWVEVGRNVQPGKSYTPVAGTTIPVLCPVILLANAGAVDLGTANATIQTVGINAGTRVTFIQNGAGTTTFRRGGSSLIRLSAASHAIAQYGTLEFVYNGTNWCEISESNNA